MGALESGEVPELAQCQGWRCAGCACSATTKGGDRQVAWGACEGPHAAHDCVSDQQARLPYPQQSPPGVAAHLLRPWRPGDCNTTLNGCTGVHIAENIAHLLFQSHLVGVQEAVRLSGGRGLCMLVQQANTLLITLNKSTQTIGHVL